MIDFILCDDRVPLVDQIIAARVHPEALIPDDVTRVLSHYVKIQELGASPWYGKPGDWPNIIVEAFTLIASELKTMQKEKTDHAIQQRKHPQKGNPGLR